MLTLSSQILKHSTGYPYIEAATHITFLDEFRMMVLTPQSTPVPVFFLFNTLVPYGDPGNLRRFRLPPRYHGWFPHIHVDSDRCLGTPDQDGPFTTDPARAVFVIRLASPDGPRNFLIVRIQTLFGHAHSMDVDGYIPWDRWGKSVAVIEVPQRVIASSGPYPLVQGLRVNLVWTRTVSGVDGTRPHLYIFDFSRRGWSDPPLLGDRDGVERRVSLKDGRLISLEGDGSMRESWFYSLGNTRFMYKVSNLRLSESNSVADAGVRNVTTILLRAV